MLKEAKEFLVPNINETKYFITHNFTDNLGDYLKHYKIHQEFQKNTKFINIRLL